MGWRHDHQTPPAISPRPGFTVLINTWKRYDLLKRSVSHYAACQEVDAIRVVWSEPSLPSDALRKSLENLVAKGNRHVKFQFDIHVIDDLNNRFKPLEGLNTDAILSIDDDVLIPCSSLETAFDVWMSAPNSMVGFVPRMHWMKPKRDALGNYEYSYGGWWSVWWTGTYSMVLSKAAFIHKKYFEIYTNQLPASLRKYVKDRRNCEDIAMSFLVANETGAPPIWVKTAVYEIGSTGISSLQGHSEHRTDCINFFVTHFGGMPLVVSHVKVADSRKLWFW
jgi:glucuronyl/N-acetylglucosaminyl transferase EXT2